MMTFWFTVPWGHGNADALGKLPGTCLIAKEPNDITARADDRHARALAQPGELRRLGNELPARPDSVSTRRRQRRHQRFRVKAGAFVVAASAGGGRRAERHGLAGLPDETSMPRPAACTRRSW